MIKISVDSSIEKATVLSYSFKRAKKSIWLKLETVIIKHKKKQNKKQRKKYLCRRQFWYKFTEDLKKDNYIFSFLFIEQMKVPISIVFFFFWRKERLFLSSSSSITKFQEKTMIYSSLYDILSSSMYRHGCNFVICVCDVILFNIVSVFIP